MLDPPEQVLDFADAGIRVGETQGRLAAQRHLGRRHPRLGVPAVTQHLDRTVKQPPQSKKPVRFVLLKATRVTAAQERAMRDAQGGFERPQGNAKILTELVEFVDGQPIAYALGGLERRLSIGDLRFGASPSVFAD